MVIRAGGLALALAALPCGAGLAAPSAAPPETPPARVVSINLCTDQLAMRLAAPGQLVSVSMLARDPRSSTMAEAAKAWPVNQGLAEEVYLLHPDLVLAGRYTARASVEMLTRLGVTVVIFDPADSLEALRAGIEKMGAALGREEAAAAELAAFDTRLAAIRAAAPAPARRPTAATYEANGYTSGAETLAGEIIETAGYRPIAGDLGFPYGGMLPLEALVMADPDLVIRGARQPGASRSEEVLDHPALAALSGASAVVEDHDWICGLPSVLDAVERLMRAAPPEGAR